MMLLRFKILLTFFLLLSQFGFTQETIELFTSTKITNYSKSDYNAESQNWNITQSDDGLIYTANTLGLLEFDGESWNLFPTSEPLRCLLIHEDKIFAGGMNTIGVFEKKNGVFKFKSLMPEKSFHDEIWKAIQIGNKIVFQSFNTFYIYDLDTKDLTRKSLTEGNISFAFKSKTETTFYYQVLYNHINITKDLIEVDNITHPALNHWMVKFIHEVEKGLLIGTYKNGLFLWDGKDFIPYENKISIFLREARLNVALPIDDKGGFAFGTLDKGIIIGNINTGVIDYYINSKNGLPSNRVHALHYYDGLLWVGSEEGVTNVNLKYPVRFINDPLAEIGPVYDVVIHKGTLYIGTNQGLYFSSDSINAPILKLQLFPYSKGQVWNLFVADNQLFCGHNEGIFEVGETFKKVYNTGGGYTFLKSRLHQDIMFQTSYYGLNIWKKRHDQWEYSHTIKKINSLTRDIIELNDGTLLLTDSWKNIYKIKLSKDLSSLKFIENLSTQKSLANSYKYRLFDLGDNKLLTTNDTIVTFKNNLPANIDLKGLTFISHPIDDVSVMKIEGQLMLYDAKEEHFIHVRKSIAELGNNQIYNYENIINIKDNFLITFTQGAGLFSTPAIENYNFKQYQPDIRKVTFWYHRNQEQLSNIVDKIPFDYNSVEFQFSSKNYYEKSNYAVRLIGYDSNWVEIGERNEIAYQNLPYGKFTFEVKDTASNKISHYKFEIDRPFYFSNLMLTVYVLAFLLSVWSLHKYYRLMLRKEKMALLLKKREDLNSQRDLNEKRIAILQANELQKELKDKNESLSELLVQSSKNKDVIQQLKHQVDNAKHFDSVNKSQVIRKLDHILTTEFDDKKDWLTFESTFRKMHQNFFSDLKNTHPALTKEDLKLCAYIRINLSTKELAPIFNITPKSVDLKRYRLRKKMNLEKGTNLYDYINQF
ncbi:triple tyrosine motif-containing protein [Flammeovirga agarivorans]|uniref:Two component regulator three Y domain-containing protein n=1 Tax=Flammeovirga agarivorans TaxID=2726742 RepID=A0A7X8SPL3_9BACT|nr:triple tyrosine motif-containing protein [Flammeovirga agarivorans]NLR94063.1 hypothetical protein [Flammeovirga agarivorans]